MKLIKQSHEILTDFSKYDGDLKQIIFSEIEVAGRTCYKSEENIKEGSAENFTNRMIKSGHGAMLEHGTIYLKCPNYRSNDTLARKDKYRDNKYSKFIMTSSECYITTNLRLLVEKGWLEDLQYICEPTEYHEKRISVRFICDRGISHELVRHRVFSFAQESTRRMIMAA